MRSYCRILILIFVALLGFSAFDCVEPQDFPYLAPVAPEFEGGVPQLRGPSKSQPQSGSGPKIAPVTAETMKNFGFGPPTETDQDQVVSNPPSPSNYPTPPTNWSDRNHAPSRSNVRREPPPVAGPTRQNGPIQQPQRVDCSQYPGLIANARSEAEMQITARYYLTCLLQQGWIMENARTQVIQTIEAAVRSNR